MKPWLEKFHQLIEDNDISPSCLLKDLDVHVDTITHYYQLYFFSFLFQFFSDLRCSIGFNDMIFLYIHCLTKKMIHREFFKSCIFPDKFVSHTFTLIFPTEFLCIEFYFTKIIFELFKIINYLFHI